MMTMETNYLRRTWAEIDLKALTDNYAAVRKLSRRKVYAVIKADAYGHGAVAVATALEQQDADGYAVSNLAEAEKLRSAGIQKPVLVLGYTPPDCAERLARGKIAQCVFSWEYANALDAQARQAGVVVEAHLKLDTGMGRIGFDFRNADDFDLEGALEVLKLPNLNTVGVFMHFAVADSVDEAHVAFTRDQYLRFWKAVEALEQVHPFRERHCCNSAGTLCLQAEPGDIVRAGIILYGLTPSDEVALPDSIRPVMSLYSVVSMVKTIRQDETVSYGRTYTAPGIRRIATVCAGYADGVPRLLSNRGSVLIRGRRAPIVGRVCMDQFCVDVTDIPDVAMGDAVTIFGPGLPVEEVADAAQTINYEIVCGITKRVPRVYINP